MFYRIVMKRNFTGVVCLDPDRLCPGCMRDKGTEQICRHCSYREQAADYDPLYLKPRTLLAGKYVTGKVLGQGGFGITYLAYDINLDLRVAIKEFFPQGLVSRRPGGNIVVSCSGSVKEHREQFVFGVESFLREAKTLARFEHHPNIVTVRDFFRENGTAYMVMSFIEGMTLLACLRRAGDRIPVEQAVNVIMPVTDALREVHRAGIMHRDISPDNIYIDREGRVVIIDFGAARQEMREKSRSLSVILKAGYAPEEQYRSRGRQGPWTDIYAVAATMYRCITGKMPPEAMDRLDEDYLEAPSGLGIPITAGLERVLLKALAIKAVDRYQTVEEFQQALLAARQGQKQESYTPDARAHRGAAYPGAWPGQGEAVARAASGENRNEKHYKDRARERPGQPSPKKARPRGDRAPLRAVVKIVLTAAAVIAGGLIIYGGINLFDTGPDQNGSAELGPAETIESSPVEDALTDREELLPNGAEQFDPALIQEAQEPPRETDEADELLPLPADSAVLSTEYHIDHESGAHALGDLPIGARVSDPTWQWEFRTGPDYSGSGPVKPVAWVVAANNHYAINEPHVTLLAEELIGLFRFDNSTDRGHENAGWGHNHWGVSGETNATYGLRPWLNSRGIHSNEGFYRSFSNGFKNAVLTTPLPNREWPGGGSYVTMDEVFIPSTTELGDSDHSWTYRIGSVYPLFSGAGNPDRAAYLGNTGAHYWLRSPFSDYGYSVRNVSSGGELYHLEFLNNYAYFSGNGVRPALNLKAGTMVSAAAE